MNEINILLRHNHISFPTGKGSISPEEIATVMMNLSYYGYALNVGGYKALIKLSSEQLLSWWKDTEKELKSLTGDNLNIGDFVVYKNFPAEVLDKSAAEYWIPQIFMYWGFPADLFTQEVKPRDKMAEQPKLKVLRNAKKETLQDIFNEHLASPARWKDQDFNEVVFLANSCSIDMNLFTFKENMVRLITLLMEKGVKVSVPSGTDILRLAAGLSDSDVSLKTNPKFKSFKRPMRKYLLSMLEDCSNLFEDAARRPEMWKRFFHNLHAGDFGNRFPTVCKVMDGLYHDRLETFNSKVEALLLKKDSSVLDLLSKRPGDFRRRLTHMLTLFGDKAAKAFVSEPVLDKLTTYQVVSMRTYLEKNNDRAHRVFPPKGNWNKMQVNDAPRHVAKESVNYISKALGKELFKRVPKVGKLDSSTEMIKLPNSGEVGPYSRGTVFPIPADVEFIRTASYWQANKNRGVTWYDNGWNFFSSDWKDLGSCCWNETAFPRYGKGTAAVFSGDPVNTGEMKGRAAQLIDLYPKKLLEAGVRYAVWNILCYSRISFSEAEEVFAALQWGKDPQSGKLFEPSRCQLAFPLTGKQMTKYICLIDLEKNEMVYLDANLTGHVNTAANNGKILEKNMPAFMEYINALPSVHDLFRESVDKDSVAHVLYSDKDVELDGEPAYIFKPENKSNKFKPMNLNMILG